MTQPVRIPADVDREDRLVANLTARQVLILTVTGLLLYGAWTITRPVLPTAVFLLLALPFGAAAAVVALGSRDGISLDRMLAAAVRQRLQPRYRVAAPDGIGEAPAWLTHHTTELEELSSPGRVSPVPLRLPAQSVTDTGVVDLGEDGMAVVAVASTVNFALRTPAEQQAVVACLARYLHSLTAPVQILIRAERLGLSEQITALRQHAASLPHPALEAAAREHADYLAQLADGYDLLRRQVLLVLREPTHPGGPTDPGAGGGSGRSRWTRRTSRAPAGQVSRRVAEVRLARRLTEATDLLAPAGVRVTALDPWQATAVLAAACNPDTLIPAAARLAASDDIITTTDPPDFDDPATSPAASLADEDLAAGPDAGLATGLADADFAGGDPADWDGFDQDEPGRSW